MEAFVCPHNNPVRPKEPFTQDQCRACWLSSTKRKVEDIVYVNGPPPRSLPCIHLGSRVVPPPDSSGVDWRYCDLGMGNGGVVCPCSNCKTCERYQTEEKEEDFYPEGSKGTICVSFKHGIGDATNFAHMIPLYRKRGWKVKVNPGHADHAPTFVAGGAEITEEVSKVHIWGEPYVPPNGPWSDSWTHNKNGANISKPPMPFIGHPHELWEEYCNVKLKHPVTKSEMEAIDLLLDKAPRPVILMHMKGFAWNNGEGAKRNYPDFSIIELQRRILSQMDGTIIVIDRDRQAPHLNCARVSYFWDFGPGHLCNLIDRSDLLIGIDSGPLNFVRFTDTPAIGIWNNHYPSDYLLPRENTLHIVSSRHAERDKYERCKWNTILGDDLPSPEFIANQVKVVMSGQKYSKKLSTCRDAQIQHFVNLVDLPEHGSEHGTEFLGKEHRIIGKAISFLGTIDKPAVVETGTIRSQEDWAGAGFSTYLFAAFLSKHGGRINSVELNPDYVKFARSWTSEFKCAEIHQQHSWDYLDWRNSSIDLFYSDSADVGTDGYQECCLEEVKKAQKTLAVNSRILIDDTAFVDGEWKGKGALAIGWLLDNGWKVEDHGWQVLMCRS